MVSPESIATSSTATERSQLTNIDNGSTILAMTFSPNGENIIISDEQNVRVWRREDGKKVAEMAAERAQCLVVSKNARWIAVVPWLGWVVVWDVGTDQSVFQHKDAYVVNGVDFSPDSTRLVVASDNGIATVWEVATGRQVVGPLYHQNPVIAAKYSPQGGRIATATAYLVRVYDSDGGHLLVDIPVHVTALYGAGLRWSGDELLRVIESDQRIKHVNASTGSLVSERLVPYTSRSCVAQPQHGTFMAYSTKRTVTFLDISTHTKLGLMNHTQDIDSIALSPDGRFLAISGGDGKVTIKGLSYITDSSPLSYLRPAFLEPEIHIDSAALDAWKRDELTDAQTLLTQTIDHARDPVHHVLASRALVRARLRYLGAALADAEKSINLLPSVFGYIAKSVALASMGEKVEAYRTCDITLERFYSTHSHVGFLLLVKAIVVFMAGEHDDAISRLDDLITTAPFHSACYVVQAYMCLLLGISCMERDDYHSAVHLFERAQVQAQDHGSISLPVISLISGWKFDNLDSTIQEHLDEALQAVGRTEEGDRYFFKMLETPSDGMVTQRYLSASESDGNATSKAHSRRAGAMVLRTNPSSSSTMSLYAEWAGSAMSSSSWKEVLAASASFAVPRFVIYCVICQHLEMTDRVTDAVECFHQMNSELPRETNTSGIAGAWAADFRQRCVVKLKRFGDAATSTQQHVDAVTQYSALLSLTRGTADQQDVLIKRSRVYVEMKLWEDALDDANKVVESDPSSPWTYKEILVEWARVKLREWSWKSALMAAAGFDVRRATIYQTLCEHLEGNDRVVEAVECFRGMLNESTQEPVGDDTIWIRNFKFHCSKKAENLGDAAMNDRKFNDAVSLYSTVLSLDHDLTAFVKRSKAYAGMGLWNDALDDANEITKVYPSSPLGYERKHAALHGLKRFHDAVVAFEVMLLKMSQSPEPDIRARSHQYIKPAETRASIRAAIQNVIGESPLVLIDTHSGRLLDKYGQASSFESQSIFRELVSSMTTQIEHARIEREVADYYRYVMLSHKWEDNEPLFDKVIRIAVYDLEESLTHGKLQMFCKIARDAGFHWAWSDTCCINRADHFVLQEALVAMFKWYRGSAETFVFLRGVGSSSRRGDLMESIWNTRAWTFQEYHASRVVRFYTEDWTLYLNIQIHNHKESPDIISEMEEATGISARALMALQPGLDDIREKLRLASTRQTTRVEDAAYSLLGIFSISLPVVYGEGNKALGRLLAQLLASSGDTSILAWTGKSGGFNSCLPANIVVFGQLPTSHIPLATQGAEMDINTARLRASSLDGAVVMKLYDRLNELPVPLFTGRRMKLPCITFKLGPLLASRSLSGYVFRAQAAALGIVEIRTEEDLSQLNHLYLIHPWIDFLLDRQPVGNAINATLEGNTTRESFSLGESEFPGFVDAASTALQTFSGQHAGPSHAGPRRGRWYSTLSLDAMSLRPPSSISHTDRETQAFQVVVRLRQPFGALLVTPDLSNVAAYRRVATENVITVQMRDTTSVVLNKLVEGVRILDVL